MNILQQVFRRLIKYRENILEYYTYKSEIRNINKKEKLYKSVELNKNQEKEIIEYWSQITGKQISTKWHRLYQSYTGQYDKKYFPEILFTTKIEKMLNPPKFYNILSDKNLLSTLFPGEDNKYRLPKTIISNSYGVFCGALHNVLTEEEAIALVNNAGRCIIKPTIVTSSGEGVRMLNMKNGIDEIKKESVQDIIKYYCHNFIIQECIEQHYKMSKLNESSLNTFRIITYILSGRVFHAPISMRMGRNGAYVDNIHAGGITIGISDIGKLMNIAFSEMGEKYFEHPDSHVVFEGYEIEQVQKALIASETLHGRIPQLRMISWDWSIDRDGVPVLIEINISGQAVWFSQMVNGKSFFGDNTEEIAQIIKK